MPASALAYLVLCAAVGAVRLVELRISRRRQRALAARGARSARDPVFPAMVALHTGVLVASALEVVTLHRPFLPAVGLPALALLALSTGLRWWVIATLGAHWNVRVVDSLSLGVVATGPYRYVRHPNYVAVFVELLALPLVHTAWLTAIVGTALHALVLGRRIAAEEAVLDADAAYRATMAGKPRFLPRLARARPGAAWPTS
jgi:methyltransferase